MKGPNPLSVGFSVLRALRVDSPRPAGHPSAEQPDHSPLARILSQVQKQGVAGLPEMLPAIDTYVSELARIDPDHLGKADALAYWLNLYNAGALGLAGDAFRQAEDSVLRVPGAFTRPLATIGGRPLTLTEIEHGKIRRFGDPRIHGALVCGSASCPTLRYEPFSGAEVNEQLDQQMRQFLAAGGAYLDDRTLLLSRVLLWYGADFVRPHRMPTLLPVGKARVARALRRWLAPEVSERLDELRVAFQPYDWGLACSVR